VEDEEDRLISVNEMSTRKEGLSAVRRRQVDGRWWW